VTDSLNDLLCLLRSHTSLNGLFPLDLQLNKEREFTSNVLLRVTFVFSMATFEIHFICVP